MKKLNYLLVFILCISSFVNAQDIDNSIGIKRDFSYGINKMKKAPKKIYINSFNVNYEIYKEAVDHKVGGNGGRIGGVTGNATARAAVGLDGIDADKMMEKTNQLFKEFKDRLISEGYEIIEADEAGKTEVLKDWEKVSGPYMQEIYDGVITCAPDDYQFYFRGLNKKGKPKQGFFGYGNIITKLSKQLGNATIVNVNMYVMFSESGNDWMKGKAAKVKIKTNLRLANDYAIVVPKKLKKKKSTMGKLFGSVQVKGATDIYPASSNMSFATHLGNHTSRFKDDLEINNVMKKEKVVAYQKQGSFTPTSFSTFSNYLDAKEDRFSNKAKWIKVDGDKYAEGFYNACSLFLKKNMDAFFEKMK